MTINGVRYRQVEICRHYEEKHSNDINDSLILELIAELEGLYLSLDAERIVGQRKLSYFAANVAHEKSVYRLVWRVVRGRIKLLVVNCF